MLSRLTVTNFQSHEGTTLLFDPGLNAIVGSSDSGKSALIRAFNWLTQGKPSGAAFVSHWAKKDGKQTEAVETEIELFDGTQIRRHRLKTDSAWVIEGDETKEYRASGGAVPEPVQELLNLHDVNYQYQMDAPFLLSVSAGERARYLNRVVNLEKMDESLKEIGSRKTRVKRSIEDLENRETDLLEKIATYSWLEVAGPELDALDAREERLKGLILDAASLSDQIQKIEDIEIPEDWMTPALQEVEALEATEKWLHEQYGKMGSLTTVIQTVERKDEGLEMLRPSIECEPDLDDLIEKDMWIARETEKCQGLQQQITSIQSLMDQQRHLEQSLKDMEEKFHENMQGVCPLCEREL